MSEGADAEAGSSRRTILFYTHAFGGGGAEIVFARLAQGFAADGDRVFLVADHGVPPTSSEPGLSFHKLPGGHGRAVVALASLLRRHKPDASFSALGAQNLKHLAAASLAGRRRRCVLGFHGFAVAEPKRLSRLCYRLTPVITRLAARTICVSDVLLDDMVRRWGGARARMLRIYNPLPDPGDQFTDRLGPPLVLALGRFEPLKRFGDLIDAFALLAPPVHLALLGEGPEREAVAARVKTHGLADRVDMPGFVADPAPWFRRAHCVAISAESESFGLTAAEALSYGLPVVATDCGGPTEVIGDARCGRIVPIGDSAALAAAMQAMLSEPGDPAPRFARAAAFAPDRVRADYAALIDRLG